MTRILILLVSLALIWSGINYIKPRKSAWEVDVYNPTLRSYLIEWESDMLKAGIDPAPVLGRLRSITVVNSNDWAGMYVVSEGVIYISKHQLDAGPASARATLYHELGHMAFGLDHGSCGIMNSGADSEKYYSVNWNLLLKEYINICYERRWESL
jgi:hypothetical protein